jgi:uncharacterized protein
VVGVTADSNIYISALQFGGLPLQFLHAARLGGFQLAVSNDLLEEITRVLREKFLWDEDRLAQALTELADFTLRVNPTQPLRVVEADPDDDRVMECAVAADSQFIVTGDKHLLELGSYGQIQILKVADFLRLMQIPVLMMNFG